MRWFSTPESANNLEITKLAIVETVLSVALYLGIGYYMGTYHLLAVVVVTAPFMLLRTDETATWGVNAFRNWRKRVRPSHAKSSVRVGVSMTFFGLFEVSVGPIVRIISVLHGVIREPLLSFRAIPENWLRQCFCTDFVHPPERFPLEASQDFYIGREIWKNIHSRDGDTAGALYVWLLLYVPAIIYRISFKSTAIAYAPFILVAQVTLHNKLPINGQLERITKGAGERVFRGLALAALGVLGAKFAIGRGWVSNNYVAVNYPELPLLQNQILANSWQAWHIALFLVAALTYGLLFFSDAALARIKKPRVWNEKMVFEIFSIASFVRASLGVTLMLYAFYVAFIEIAPRALLRQLGI